MALTQTRARGREGGGWAQEMLHDGGMDQEEWLAEMTNWEPVEAEAMAALKRMGKPSQ